MQLFCIAIVVSSLQGSIGGSRVSQKNNQASQKNNQASQKNNQASQKNNQAGQKNNQAGQKNSQASSNNQNQLKNQQSNNQNQQKNQQSNGNNVPGNTGTTRGDILKYHNTVRCMHGVGKLQWDDSLAKGALPWAKTDAGNKKTTHDPKCLKSSTCNENVAGRSGFGGNGSKANDLQNQFYTREEVKYNYNNPKPSAATSHFTMMVWKDLDKVGCAQHRDDGNKKDSMVCHYSPKKGGTHGNTAGQYDENVKKPTKTAEQCGGSSDMFPKWFNDQKKGNKNGNANTANNKGNANTNKNAGNTKAANTKR